jgi:hypothetical protein
MSILEKLLIIFSFFLIPFCWPKPALAQFSSVYEINYQVGEDGLTTVTQNVHLTNLTTNYYASEYTFTLGAEDLSQISARDELGPLKMETKKEPGQTQIHVVFNSKVFGQGKVLNWTLTYQTRSVARKEGRIWEITLPRVSQEGETASYSVDLSVPSSFGLPVYISPTPKRLFFWTLEEGSTEGITVAFGDWQGYRFNLTYHLENSGVSFGKTSIAIPADNQYQKIILDSITPEPKEMIVDQDGNWLAYYVLLPRQKLTIEVNGYAQIFLKPRNDYPQDEENGLYQRYLSPQKYWEQDDQIKKLATDLKTPQAIYDFVVSKLSYNYERAGQESDRFGASLALKNSNAAVCMEFTDLFIALCRAAGIPAREIDGYAYSPNSKLRPLSLVTDILHAWPEYWDKQKKLWVQVDPTWGKTSGLDYFNHFDFNHLAFVKRGISSTDPYPAGSYKDEQESKDVNISFSSVVPSLPLVSPEISLNVPDKNLAGFPLAAEIDLNNKNQVALYNLNFKIFSDKIAPHSSSFDLTMAPPLSIMKFPLNLENKNQFLFTRNTLKVLAGGQQTVASFWVLPGILLLIIFLFFLFLIFFFGIKIIRKINVKILDAFKSVWQKISPQR